MDRGLSVSVKKCVIAGAGTGKTTYLLNLALNAPQGDNVLYLTYTVAASLHFEKRLKERLGAVPRSITIMTWFSFLLSHGVRPFPYPLPGVRPRGIHFTERKISPRRGVTRDKPSYYLANKENDVHSSRLAGLACLCDENASGEAVRRISDIFQLILVDEAQDLSSYDYDYLAKLMGTPSSVIVVGDPRQRTYATTHEGAHLNETVFDYMVGRELCEIDTDSLTVCHRCKPDVVSLANELFPDLPALRPAVQSVDEHVKILAEKEFVSYREELSAAMSLSWQTKALPIGSCSSMTMGASKGSEFEDVVVWLTGPMAKWLDDRKAELRPQARARLYVAITRARNNLWLIRP